MKFYVLGDIGVDAYHVGTVRGLSAETPIPIIDVQRKELLPAMAANVLANLNALGIDAELVTPASMTRCPAKNRLLTADGQQLARWDESDTCAPYSLADLVPLMNADAIIVADYGKGAITPQVIDVLRQATVPTFVDTKGDPTPWIGAEEVVLFPNLVEYTRYAEKYAWFPHVVLKLGARGIAYVEFGKVILQRPALANYARCVNGAGDTVIASFALATMLGITLPECLELANAAAANVVEQSPLERQTTADAVLERLDGIQNQTTHSVASDDAGDACSQQCLPAGEAVPAREHVAGSGATGVSSVAASSADPIEQLVLFHFDDFGPIN